jgi:hypothetical protein
MSEPPDQADHPSCRAISRDGDPPDNPLFTPPCDCPRCAPDRTYDRDAGRDGWLRVLGHEQRYRVEVVELGTVGKAILG